MVERDRLTVVGEQARLVVEGVDMRDAAGHEQEDDALGPGREMRRPGSERIGGRRIGGEHFLHDGWHQQ